ncbi:MAG TPA: OsmC family protein [Bryobacteraceae bacterium]|nr:OsmC family protein [Bryobacteraceae bacterium]HOQ46383.1 OsmC family protein [Bryobacteraceae bacterium]HPQ14245.1 OsmC family protein [Bryobacteraceae bacterium]HPU72180.1 OsmC family protein [Bryobacteraceae bacterium]
MAGQKAQVDTLNGVNVSELRKTIDGIKATPGLAKFKFRIRNEWDEGGHNRSTVGDFYGANQEIPHQRQFVLEADEPQILLGKDRGANPVEYLLHALAACVTSSMVYHAAARGIRIDEIESTLEGDIDLQGFLGLRKDVRRGYQNIRMNFKIKADAPDDQLQAICDMGPQFSPVFDSISKGVPITVKAEPMR